MQLGKSHEMSPIELFIRPGDSAEFFEGGLEVVDGFPGENVEIGEVIGCSRFSPLSH